MSRRPSPKLLTPVMYPALLDAIEKKFGSVEELHRSGNFTYSTSTIKDYLAGNIELNAAQKEELAKTMETKVEIIDEELLKPPGGKTAYEAEHGAKVLLPENWMDMINVQELNRLRRTGREPVTDKEIAEWAGVASATVKSFLFGTSRQRGNTKETILRAINRRRPDLILLTFENVEKERQDKLAAKATKAEAEAVVEAPSTPSQPSNIQLDQLVSLLKQLGLDVSISGLSLEIHATIEIKSQPKADHPLGGAAKE